eukprot:12311190-Ditylum_brightwellii.AAC.1
MPGAKIIEQCAFAASGVAYIEFGDKLETIGNSAFESCRRITMTLIPCLRAIEEYAFCNCKQLTALELPEGLERIVHCSEANFHAIERRNN